MDVCHRSGPPPTTRPGAIASRATVVSLAVLAGALGCSAERSGLPTFEIRGIEARSVLDVPPGEMRAAVANAYRVRPDRRFLGAVAEAHHLASGRPPGTVTATFQAGTWTIEYAGERVGDLPELAGFEDARALLAAWSIHLLARHPLGGGTSAAADERRRVSDSIATLRPVAIVSGLQRVDSGWSRGRRLEWLVLGARGLALLTAQLPRVDILGDPLAARALAATMLAEAAGAADSVADALVLLAEQLGYTVESVAAAARLPPTDPVRLYAERDTAALRTARGHLARFLYLAALARNGGRAAWRRWVDHVVEVDITSGVLAGALHFRSFEPGAAVAPRVPRQLFAELDALAVRHAPVERNGGALRPTAGTAGWSVLFEDPTEGGRRLAGFETDVDSVVQRFSGPFLGAELGRAYFRAQLHRAFERSCVHLVDGLASIEGGLTFALQFDSAPPGVWTEMAGWCAHHAGVPSGETPFDTSLADIRNLSSLSDHALGSTLKDLATHRGAFRRPAAEALGDLDLARALFARLDSRPTGLDRAGDAAKDLLHDLPLGERYYARLLALASPDRPRLAVWYAFHVGDRSRLEALGRDPRIDREVRFSALLWAGRLGGDSAAVRAEMRRLIAEDAEEWPVRHEYIRQVLEPARRFEEAARVAREWLNAHPGSGGFDRLFAVTALARQYQSMGRARQARELIAPIVRSHQAGVMQRAALIALDLGDAAAANVLAHRVVERYPTSAAARVTLAVVRWKARDDAGAAAAVADPNYPLSREAWRVTVAPAFAHAFGRRPVGEAIAALRAMAKARAHPVSLAMLPRAAVDSGHRELAVALAEEVAARGNPRVMYLDVYRHLREARGDAAALEWLAERWPPPQPPERGMDFYRERLFELLWTITTEPDRSSDGSFLWLVRALAALQQPQPQSAEWRELVTHYRRAGSGPYDVAGRFLVGLESEATMLRLAESPKRRVEYSYYLGIKALSERRLRDASEWLRVAMETRQTGDGEFLLAKEQLARWSRSGKTLERAVSGAPQR